MSESTEDWRRPGETCWRVERADKAAVVIDADTYFRAAREAMMAAKHQILLVGWDFDARIKLAWDDEADDAPTTVGAFLEWLVERTPTLQIYILRWDKGALKTLGRGKTLWTLTRWRLTQPRIHLGLDGYHPPLASQHHKIVVIDDCLAFCGGIDMTDERWDTRDHADDQPHRRSPRGKAYKPWHDATTALTGPVASALGQLCRARWEIAGGSPIPPPLSTGACWPDVLTPDFTDVDVAISRSAPDHDEQRAVREVEELYLALIARARRRFYAESQYFASRRVAKAIADRLKEDDPPEFVIVNPISAQGWLEPIAMDTARARLVESIRRADRHDRFRLYHPVTAAGAEIYCHAKIVVVDEDVIRVGSSNFNNRSLRLDTECDVTIADDGPAIARIRADLLAEHLAVDLDDVTRGIADHGLIATVERLRVDRGSGKTLIPYETLDLTSVERYLAEHEVLDPEGPDEMFEAIGGTPLLRGFRRAR